jgi:hypothetical protein
MKPSKVHTCVFQEQVAMGKQEPNIAKKCRCQQLIDYKAANERVKLGEALWVVTKRERGEREEICSHCAGMNDSRSCDRCKGTGKVQLVAIFDEYNNDIVLVNHRTSTNRISTPKTPTIESEHILRFVTFDGENDRVAKEAKERVEEYGRMIQWSLQHLGAELLDFKTKDVLIEGRPEPPNRRVAHAPGTITFKDGSKNKSWYWEIDGRDNDYGRTV